jgi:polygalacturonase
MNCFNKINIICDVPMQSITFNWANNIVISGLTSINSQLSHLVINSCNNVEVRNVKLVAPDQSPNTDGIHVQASTGVTIQGSTLQTGDDCISIGPGTKNLLIRNIKCGPGHGVRYIYIIYNHKTKEKIILDFICVIIFK